MTAMVTSDILDTRIVDASVNLIDYSVCQVIENYQTNDSIPWGERYNHTILD